MHLVGHVAHQSASLLAYRSVTCLNILTSDAFSQNRRHLVLILAISQIIVFYMGDMGYITPAAFPLLELFSYLF